jgi:chromate transporter
MLPTTTHRPTPLALFLIFSRIGLTSFGGGLSGWLLREFVWQRKWMTEEEFLNGLVISQALPGINVTNISVWIGYRLLGRAGAAVAFCGILIPPAIAIIILALLFETLSGYEVTHLVLQGAAAAAVGLSLTTGAVAARRVLREVLPTLIMVLTFVAVGILQWPILWILVVAGPASIAIAYYKV